MHSTVDIYPVGLLAGLLRVARSVRAGRLDLIRWSLRGLLGDVRYIGRRVREGEWRSAKNALNGYLAEPTPWPQDRSLRRCGSGWTRRRALRSLHRHGYRPGGSG